MQVILLTKQNMKVILITTDTFFVEEDIILNALFEEGLDVLHLRKPDSEPVLCERLLTLMPPKWYDRIVVHDHFYLKEEYGLKGIHLNKRNPEIPEGYKGHLSRSCQSLQEVVEWKKKCDYVFLSPVFDPTTPSVDCEPYSLQTLKEAQQNGIIDNKVIALGGVNEDNVRKAKDLGFGGIGIMAAVWQNFDFHKSDNFKILIDYFKKIRAAAD